MSIDLIVLHIFLSSQKPVLGVKKVNLFDIVDVRFVVCSDLERQVLDGTSKPQNLLWLHSTVWYVGVDRYL